MLKRCVTCRQPRRARPQHTSTAGTDVRCLEFDREDPSRKSAALHRLLGSGVARQRILDEIEKCSVRCSNCHQKRTMRMQGSWREAFHQAQAWTGAADRLARLLPRPG